MLIKKDARILNLMAVEAVLKDKANNLRFVMTSDYVDFKFESSELRDKAFENILDAYRWQRSVCDLNLV